MEERKEGKERKRKEKKSSNLNIKKEENEKLKYAKVTRQFSCHPNKIIYHFTVIQVFFFFQQPTEKFSGAKYENRCLKSKKMPRLAESPLKITRTWFKMLKSVVR